MKLRTAASIAMIIFAIGLCFWLFVRPMITPPEEKARFVNEEQLYYVGSSEAGGRKFMYADIKDEAKEWMKILAPVITFFTAWFMRKKK